MDKHALTQAAYCTAVIWSQIFAFVPDWIWGIIGAIYGANFLFWGMWAWIKLLMATATTTNVLTCVVFVSVATWFGMYTSTLQTDATVDTGKMTNYIYLCKKQPPPWNYFPPLSHLYKPTKTDRTG